MSSTDVILTKSNKQMSKKLLNFKMSSEHYVSGSFNSYCVQTIDKEEISFRLLRNLVVTLKIYPISKHQGLKHKTSFNQVM